MKKISLNEIINFLQKNNIIVQVNNQKNIDFDSLGSTSAKSSNFITFFHNTKYENSLKNTKAKACFIRNEHINKLNSNCLPIIVEDPYLAFAYTTHLFADQNQSNGIIDKSSIIHEKTVISKNVQIDNNVIINKNCKIEENVIINQNSVIGPNVIIKKNSLVMSNCSIFYSEIGENCLIQSGAVIGGKGFGFTSREKIEVKHLGKVSILNNVEIGSNTTIDRGTIDSTLIGKNVRIDNLVQIAHNVEIGDNSMIAAQVGIAGSTKIGKNCAIGGQAGISGHLNIGENVKIAAKSGVTKNIADNSIVAGFPAQDIMKWKKSIIAKKNDN